MESHPDRTYFWPPFDGKGYGFRLRWKEILDGKRTPDPAYTNAVKLSLAYAVGNPGKLPGSVKAARIARLPDHKRHGAVGPAG